MKKMLGYKKGTQTGYRINAIEQRKHIVEVEYPRAVELNKQYELQFKRLREIIRILKGKNPDNSMAKKIVEVPVQVNTDEYVQKQLNKQQNIHLQEIKKNRKDERIKTLLNMKRRLEFRDSCGLSAEEYRQWFLKTIDNDLEAVKHLHKRQITGEELKNSFTV